MFAFGREKLLCFCRMEPDGGGGTMALMTATREAKVSRQRVSEKMCCDVRVCGDESDGERA